MCIQESNDKSYLTLPTAISLKTHLYSVNRHADRILEGKAGNITERTVSFDRSRPKAVSLFMLFVFCFLTVFLNPTLSIYASDITTWSELQIALNNGGDVTLTQNITAGPSDLALDIPADKTVTLDLAGFTIDRGLLQQNNAAKINGNVITVNGTLILNDSNESKTGTIKGGNNASDGGGILVSANGKFIMNNGTISNNTAFTNGGGVYIASGGEFTMNDGTISNNYASGDGGGVCNDQGIFVMEDGEISANSAYDSGGGVALFTSSFTMNEGKIAGNQANNYGGGVYLYYHSTFIMNAGIIGSISDDSGGNIAKYGSGVSLLSDYTKDCYFTMNGGMITNNGNPECAGGGGVEIDQGIFTLKNGTLSVNQARFGGGIYNGSGTFSMEGGEITDNTAMDIGGGVYSAYSYPNIIFTMQGNVRVEGNNSPFGPDNFNLIHKDQGPNTITITGPLEGSVGITKSTLSPYTPTKGWFAMAESGLLSEKDKNVFFSDNPNFAVDKKTSPASVYLVDGVYSLTFNSNGAESGNLPDVPRKYLSGDTITVPDNTGNLVKTRYVFNGWSTVSNPTTENPGIHYDVGDTFDITENMTLYAQWYIIPATIPTINTQPADVELPYGYAEHILSVAAAAAEDADYTLSYQWYSNTSKANTGGTIIENATNNSYTIPIGKNVGITEYYYCVITATRDDNEETATVASNAVSVTITKAVWESKTATGSAMYGNSGEADLSGLIAPGSTVGNIIFKDENGYETTELPEMLNDIPTITSGLLRYVFKNDAANVNKTVVIYIPVSNNANFSDYEIAVTLTVLDKNKESLTITQNGTTFGTELPDPVYTTPEGTSQTLNYSGMLRKDGSSYGPTHIRPTEAGSYLLTVICEKADTVYTGSSEFTIDPANISAISVTLGEMLTYNGSEQTQTVNAVGVKSENIINECVISGNTGRNAGNYTLTVTAKDESNYTGSVNIGFTIAKKNIIPVIEITGTYSFTGNEIIPDYEVKDGESLLAESDYNAVLDANINAGTDTGKMIVSASDTGNYVFEQQTVNFTIQKAAAPTLAEINVSDFYTITSRIVPITGMPTNAGELIYTLGTVISPERLNVSVTINSNDSINISFSDGMAEDKIIVPVTIQSANYENTSVNIILTLCEKEDAKVSILEGNDLVGIALTKIWGDSLSLNSEAEVTGENGFWTWRSSNENIATVDSQGDVRILQTGTTTITAEYESLTSKGQSSFTLTVEAKDISGSTVTISGEYIYNGEAHTPENNKVSVLLDGLSLNAGSDYTFIASHNINAGTANVVISGAGNYTGTASGSFSISKAFPVLSELPIAAAITYGQMLGDSELSGGEMKLGAITVPGIFSWAVSDTVPTTADSQTTEYEVIFTPNDTENFESTSCKVKLLVNPGVPGVTPPSNVQNLIYNGDEQELVISGSAENGVILYNVNDSAFSSILPKGKNSGNYTVNWYVKGNENYGDSGSESDPLGTLTITISQKAVTVTAEDKEKKENEANPTLTAKVEGIIGNDTVEYEISREPGENAGTYIITPYGEAKQGNYTITYKTGTFTIVAKDSKTYSIQFNGNGGSGSMVDQIVTEGISIVLPPNSFTRDGHAFSEWNTKSDGSGDVYEDGASVSMNMDITLFAQWKPVGQQEIIEQTELTYIPKGLEKLFASLLDLKYAMIRKMMIHGKPVRMDHTVFYDIVLIISLDGGIKWKTATEDNFPIDGIWITLPYPAGTSKNTHHFSACHMFTVTSPRLGTKAGDVEIPTIILTDKGLRMKLRGLSPVAISWSPIEPEDDETMEFPVEITTVQGNGFRGVPDDVKDQTISLKILLKQNSEIKIQSEDIKLDVTHGGNVKPVDKVPVKFIPDVPDFTEIAANYDYEVLVSPTEIEADIYGADKDVPFYNLKAVAGFNGEKFTVTLFWNLREESKSEEMIQVYALPEDEVGAYALRPDGTKEYLIFQTYDICMAYLGREELCSGPEKCFHK